MIMILICSILCYDRLWILKTPQTCWVKVAVMRGAMTVAKVGAMTVATVGAMTVATVGAMTVGAMTVAAQDSHFLETPHQH